MAGIELVFFICMILVFVICLLLFKIPAGVSLMISAIIGALISGFGFPLRHLVEGTFGYIDPILTITAAMIFMVVLEKNGALAAASVYIVEKLHRFPTLLLIAFMGIIMFPGMITGSTIASVVSAGGLVAPIMLGLGIPKSKTAAIVGIGGVLGMVAPPINIPVMVICDVVDMPYIGFTLPLLALAVPLAIFTVLFLGRKHIGEIDVESLHDHMDFSIKDEVNWTVFLPIIVLVLLTLLQNVFPRHMIQLGLPLTFMLSAVAGIFVGRKFNFLEGSKEGIKKSLGAMVLLMGVGMFVQIITLNGARAFFVINALSLKSNMFLLFLSIAITVPLFGGISAFGSASILGGPFVMALAGPYNAIIVGAVLSLLTGIGEFIPPTAMAATFACEVVDDEEYKNMIKPALIPLGVMLAYGMLFIVVVARVLR